MHIPLLDEKIDLYHATTNRHIGRFRVDGYPERIARNARGFQLDLEAETPSLSMVTEAIFRMPTQLEIQEFINVPPLEAIPVKEEISTMELVKVIQISNQGFFDTLHVILMSRDGHRFVRGRMKIVSLSKEMNQALYYDSILFLHDTTKSRYKQSDYYSSIVVEHSTEKSYSQPLMTGIIVFVTDDTEMNIDMINPSFIYIDSIEISNPHIYALLEEERNDEIKVKAKTLVSNVIFKQMDYEKGELSNEELLSARVFFLNDQIIAMRDGFIRFYYKFESDDFFYPNTVHFLLYDGDDFITEAIVYLKI